MTPLDLLPDSIHTVYEVREWNHACAILKADFPAQWDDIIKVLAAFRFRKSKIIASGGSKSTIADGLEQAFNARGWEERSFRTKLVIDNEETESETHKIDCYKDKVGLEIEWNSKDQTFDRDLNNFRSLFELRRISVGVIVTRSDELQEIFNKITTDCASCAGTGKRGKAVCRKCEGRGQDVIGKKYGASTTHMGKLIPRIESGRGGGCPVLVFGISSRLYVEGE